LRRRKDIKYFDPGKAVKTRKEDRVRIIRMPSERNRAAETSATEKS
jgi:NADH-quinone oxidoreductase subunit J